MSEGSTISAIDALEEAVKRMSVKEQGYKDSYNITHSVRFLDYANIVKEDIDIIYSLEQEYGLIKNNGVLEKADNVPEMEK